MRDDGCACSIPFASHASAHLNLTAALFIVTDQTAGGTKTSVRDGPAVVNSGMVRGKVIGGGGGGATSGGGGGKGGSGFKRGSFSVGGSQLVNVNIASGSVLKHTDEAAIAAALAAVRSDADDADYVTLRYVHKNQLELVGGGVGGWSAIAKQQQEDTTHALFSLLRVTDKIDKSMTVKFAVGSASSIVIFFKSAYTHTCISSSLRLQSSVATVRALLSRSRLEADGARCAGHV
jgi:hypothetical protein